MLHVPCVYGLVFVRTSVLVVVVLYSGFLHDFCVCVLFQPLALLFYFLKTQLVTILQLN